MANHVNVVEIGELLDEKPFDMNWFSYDLGAGWGQKLTRYRKKGAAQGIFTPGISNETSIPRVYKKLKNHDFKGIAGFYVAILCFFGEKIYENIDFVDKTPKNSINTVVSKLKCPERFKDEIYEICHTEYDFLDFIKAAYRLPKTVFDENSAISVYKLQGNACIYPLLCQMFYVNKGFDYVRTCLINGLPVDFEVDISDFFSGCNFPVCVSPSISQLKWAETENGWFLFGYYNDSWVVVDVAGVGRVNLSNYALADRINYWGRGGVTVPYVICYNWGEILEAYALFNEESVLIRDLSNNLFDNYWFNFGPNSLLNVKYKNRYINTIADYQVVPAFEYSNVRMFNKIMNHLTINLKKDFVNYCDAEDVIFSDDEVYDILELGSFL